MKDFKEIAEKCLAGELSGTFVLHNGDKKHVSKKNQTIRKDHLDPYSPYIIGNRKYSRCGVILPISDNENPYDIVDFIPDTGPEQITIDIPEGKVLVMEQTEKGVVITWKEKELTYDDKVNECINNSNFIYNYILDTYIDSPSSQSFYKKVEVLRKLTNIRNYFGKPKHFCDGVVIKCVNSYCGVETGQFYFDKPDLDSLHEVVFAKKEHAEEAIKMLGDELKYLFEPW